MYADDGDDHVVVASDGGADRAPGWLYNVRADPSVEVHVGNDRYPATRASSTPPIPPAPRLWQLVNHVNGNRYEHVTGENHTPDRARRADARALGPAPTRRPLLDERAAPRAHRCWRAPSG